MKFITYYLRAVALITLALGLTLLFFPKFLGLLFFNEINNASLFFISITGSTLVGYSVLNFFASFHKNNNIKELAVWGNLATLLVATVLTLIYYTRFDSFGWLILLQHTVFASGFTTCIYLYKKS